MKITTADGLEIDLIEPVATSVTDGIHLRTGETVLALCFVEADGSAIAYQLTATRAFDLVNQIVQFGRDHSEPDTTNEDLP